MELSYAGKKIRNKRRLNIIKLILVVLLTMLCVIGIYVLFLLIINPGLKLIDTEQEKVLGILIVLLISVVFSFIAAIIAYFILNKKYKDFHIRLLRDEAMLDGLSLFEIPAVFNDVEKQIIEDYLGIENVIPRSAFTQTSSTAYFELFQVNYANNQSGIIIKTKIDFINDEIVIIRDDNRRGKLDYNDKNIKQYGIGLQSNNTHKFALYTSLGNEVYQYINNDAINELYKFVDFCKTQLALILIDDNLIIFVDGWKMDMKKSMFNRDGYVIIDAQIEALKILQSYIEHTMLLIDTKNKEEE